MRLRGAQGVMRLLLEKVADVMAVDEVGMTPLHLAAIVGNEAMIGPILENSANVMTRA